jgi:predicted nucleic acid-binding protein
MPKDLPYYYWDACVPLSYINGITDRLQHIDALMSKSGEDFQLVTSVLSITEVAFATSEKDKKALDPDAEVKISKLWQAGSPIKLVEFYELIALNAKQLMRGAIIKGWSLRPADAIHLATADQLKVKAFHTYDEKLEKFSVLTETKFPIIPPISDEPHLPLVNVTPNAEPTSQDGQETVAPQEPATSEPKPKTEPLPGDKSVGNDEGLTQGRAPEEEQPDGKEKSEGLDALVVASVAVKPQQSIPPAGDKPANDAKGGS